MSRSPKLSLKPHKMKSLNGTEAWWYENEDSIDVYISDDSGTLSCRIRRNLLENWLRRIKDAKVKE